MSFPQKRYQVLLPATSMKFRNMEEGKRFLLTKYQTRKDYAVTEVNFIPFAFFYRLI